MNQAATHTNNLPQRVVVYMYDRNGVKLAHVGVYAMTFTTGKPNNGWTLTNVVAKARWASEKFVSYGVKSDSYTPSCEHMFDSGFHAMLMNTDMSFWSVEGRIEDVSLEHALQFKSRLVDELHNQGYIVTNRFNRKTVRQGNEVGNKSWGKPLMSAHNCTQAKIYKICEKLTVGMSFENLEDYVKVRRSVYNMITNDKGPGVLTKGQVWSMFNSVALEHV